ncbi:hypothetical protein [Parapedobacter indicus]|uniref:Uncharacterized protein n=1 Tax=Parapedobacter indicus TaxID=1477437 RepID=A0A1I3SPJ1_9SPHI|nr:hypothetical protein [Parapedobacter indicus]PPK99745.1 hypothetical protein CLV26_11178 [Parapedobacter indicus]SFJ60300.1 hypothetical protein SAMN05444682_111121 [Parapedobacter indicus]
MIEDNFNGATVFFNNMDVQNNTEYATFFAKFRNKHDAPLAGKENVFIYEDHVAGLSPFLIKRVLTFSECVSN